jgi:hypothetical protein
MTKLLTLLILLAVSPALAQDLPPPPPLPEGAQVDDGDPVQPPVVVYDGGIPFVFYAGFWYPWTNWCAWYGYACGAVPPAGFFYGYPPAGRGFPGYHVWVGPRPGYPDYRYGGSVYHRGWGYHPIGQAHPPVRAAPPHAPARPPRPAPRAYHR